MIIVMRQKHSYFEGWCPVGAGGVLLTLVATCAVVKPTPPPSVRRSDS